MNKLYNKIKSKWVKLRLEPIHVFCFHHVCRQFDADYMHVCDWMQIDKFKSVILEMRKEGVEFISLSKAYCHLGKDAVRRKRYVVLSFDDGYATLMEILPWLDEQKIPVVLFVNGKYLDGKSYRENPKEQYLTKEELFALTSPLIEIGSHGWEHTDASKMKEYEFEESMMQNIDILSSHPCYIPFHAYTWGRHTVANDASLAQMHLVYVLMDGMTNYSNQQYIHRELLKK